MAGTVILIDNVGKQVDENTKVNPFDAGCVVLVNYIKEKVDSLKGEYPSPIELYRTLRDKVDAESLYQKEWVNPGGKIANIYFANRDYGSSSVVKDEHPLKLCCILVSGCMAFDQLTFRQFRNAIVWANKYADQKEVTRCYFMHDRYQSEEHDPNKEHYLLDFGNVGDALVCRGNGFNSESSKGARFLRIHQCFGGSIADNIINGDVDISGCKGLDFTGNHLENGAQLAITSSVINLSNNYFEKGVRPNIVIKSNTNMDSPVVNLANNSFVYISTHRPLLVNGSWNGGYKDKNYLSDVCDYDIVFVGIAKKNNNAYIEYDPMATVNISNSMRYWAEPVRNTYPMGIKIGWRFDVEGASSEISPYKDSLTPYREFNNRSQIYSTRSTLLVGRKIAISSDSVSLEGLQSVNISKMQETTTTKWYGETDRSFNYQYQFIWDFDKSYSTPLTSLPGEWRPGNYPIATGYKGVLFTLGSSEVGVVGILRVIRTAKVVTSLGTINDIKYVDVPLITCRKLYDNGFTLNGFKWEKATSVDAVTIKGTSPSEITYIGKKCIVDK